MFQRHTRFEARPTSCAFPPHLTRVSRQAAAAAVAALTAVTALAGALTAGAEAKAAPAELAQTVTLLHDGALLTPVAPMPLQARATLPTRS